MRSSNKSRSRNKPGGHNNQHNQRRNVGNVMNRVFDSAGPDGKVRGTPQQIIDKYNVLARDAQLSGDRVAAESFLQHSEHYTRLLGDAVRQQQEQRQAQEQQREEQQQRENQRREEAQARQKAEQARTQAQAQPESETSGLTTIEATGPENAGGPVETPENKPAAVANDEVAAAPVVKAEKKAEQEAPADTASDEETVAAAEPAPKPKRPRARRKPKVEKSGDAPAAG